MEMLADAKSEIDQYGPNPGLVGSPIDPSSGRAIELLQAAGIAELGPFFIAYRTWKLRVYRAVWCAVQQFWTSERWIRVTDDQDIAQFVQLNGWETRPAERLAGRHQPAGCARRRHRARGGPERHQHHGAMRSTRWSGLAKTGTSVPPELIVELSSLPASRQEARHGAPGRRRSSRSRMDIAGAADQAAAGDRPRAGDRRARRALRRAGAGGAGQGRGGRHARPPARAAGRRSRSTPRPTSPRRSSTSPRRARSTRRSATSGPSRAPSRTRRPRRAQGREGPRRGAAHAVRDRKHRSLSARPSRRRSRSPSRGVTLMMGVHNAPSCCYIERMKPLLTLALAGFAMSLQPDARSGVDRVLLTQERAARVFDNDAFMHASYNGGTSNHTYPGDFLKPHQVNLHPAPHVTIQSRNAGLYLNQHRSISVRDVAEAGEAAVRARTRAKPSVRMGYK